MILIATSSKQIAAMLSVLVPRTSAPTSVMWCPRAAAADVHQRNRSSVTITMQWCGMAASLTSTGAEIIQSHRPRGSTLVNARRGPAVAPQAPRARGQSTSQERTSGARDVHARHSATRSSVGARPVAGTASWGGWGGGGGMHVCDARPGATPIEMPSSAVDQLRSCPAQGSLCAWEWLTIAQEATMSHLCRGCCWLVWQSD